MYRFRLHAFTVVFLAASMLAVIRTATLSAQGPDSTGAQWTVQEASSPVVNEAQFFIAAPLQLVVPATESAPVDIQLRIRNGSKDAVQFPLFDAFRLIVKTADGVVVPDRGGRDRTMRPHPLVLAAGSSFTLVRQAKIERQADGTATLMYFDGTGSEAIFSGLQLGKSYSLAFSYDSVPEITDTARTVRDASPSIWYGAATTAPITVSIDS